MARPCIRPYCGVHGTARVRTRLTSTPTIVVIARGFYLSRLGTCRAPLAAGCAPVPGVCRLRAGLAFPETREPIALGAKECVRGAEERYRLGQPNGSHGTSRPLRTALGRGSS